MKSEKESSGQSLFDQLGGRPTIERVHKIFYDKVYGDPWLKLFFSHIAQEAIEVQQTDFMSQAFGGPQKYCGALPIPAHKHMNISEELFLHRHALLEASLAQAGLAGPLVAKWLRIDSAFRNGLVKSSVDACQKRYINDLILDFPRPR